MVNHIPNCNLLTNKMGLLTSLQAYERVSTSVKRRDVRIRFHDFIPQTYRLDDPKERELFLEAFKEDTVWISKPTGLNQGKGIYLVRDMEQFQRAVQEHDARQQTRRPHRPNMGRVIQRYISAPLLLEGRKFDIRAYMLVAGTVPYLVLYHKGYLRLSLVDYNLQASDLTAHLTNQYIQKKDPSYKDAKEATVWSMDKFNDHINKHVAAEKGLAQDWVYNGLETRMKQIMLFCFHAVKNRLHCKIGYFDLYGLDFMIDEDMKVWLIEVNVNPSLATNCEALHEVIPGVVKEALHLTIECFEKSRKSQPLMPLQSLQNFQVLFNGCTKSPNRAITARAPRMADSSMQPHPRARSQSPVHRTNTRSPLKDATSQGQGQGNRMTKGQGQSESVGKGNASRGALGMTPTATTRLGCAPPLPAVWGAVPATGNNLERSAVSAALTASEQIKLKMTHNSPVEQSEDSIIKDENRLPVSQGTPALLNEQLKDEVTLLTSPKATLGQEVDVTAPATDTNTVSEETKKSPKTKLGAKPKEGFHDGSSRTGTVTKKPTPKPRTILRTVKNKTERVALGIDRGN